MSVQLTQLRCFVAVATELHFGRAARMLNMSQPPLTRHVQMLEHALGVTLFDRNKRSVRLTASGRALLPDAQEVLRRLANAEISVKRAAEGTVGSVVMGFIPASSYAVLPRLLALAKQHLPDVDIVLREMQSLDQYEALSNETIELGLVRPITQRPEISNQALLKESFVLAIPMDHPLAAKTQVKLADLDDQPFIMYSLVEGRYSYEMLVGAFRMASCSPRYVQYITFPHSMLSLVSVGLGLALVPRSATKLRLNNVHYAEVELDGSYSEVHLAWRQNNLNPAAIALKNLLLTEGLLMLNDGHMV